MEPVDPASLAPQLPLLVFQGVGCVGGAVLGVCAPHLHAGFVLTCVHLAVSSNLFLTGIESNWAEGHCRDSIVPMIDASRI